MAGADGDGQRVAAGLGHKLLHLLRAGIGGILGGHVDFILDAGQGTQLGLHHHAVVVSIFHHLAGQGNVLGEGLGGGIDHHGGEAVLDAGLAQLKAVAVVQMQHNGQARLNNGGLHQLLQIGAVGIGARALGHLQDQGGLQLSGGLGNPLNDLHVVDVEGTDGVTAVVSLLEHFLGSNQWHNKSLLLKNWS